MQKLRIRHENRKSGKARATYFSRILLKRRASGGALARSNLLRLRTHLTGFWSRLPTTHRMGNVRSKFEKV